MPGGPPSLWALTDMRSTPSSRNDTGMCPTAAGSVAMDRDPRLAAQCHDLVEGLQRADFVVGELTIHERRLSPLTQQVVETRHVQPAGSFHRQFDELAGSPAGFADARMLDGGARQWSIRAAQCRAGHGRVGSLGGAAREDHPRRISSEEVRHDLPCRLDHAPRPPALLVHAAGISDATCAACLFDPA